MDALATAAPWSSALAAAAACCEAVVVSVVMVVPSTPMTSRHMSFSATDNALQEGGKGKGEGEGEGEGRGRNGDQRTSQWPTSSESHCVVKRAPRLTTHVALSAAPRASMAAAA